jgi:hypothetical protein
MVGDHQFSVTIGARLLHPALTRDPAYCCASGGCMAVAD